MPYYTGVGSRETPPEIIKKLRFIAHWLARNGFILRSGAADGADTAFEQGCDHVAGGKKIYLPWKNFSRRFDIRFVPISDAAYELASTLHPAWIHLKPGMQSLHARNTYQVLGEFLDSPSDFTVCWTADGAETLEAITKKTGGTATAIRLSLLKGIPVFNLRNEASVERFKTFLKDKYNIVLGEGK